MIPVYTLTPNPALDLSGHVASIVPNEKNYVVRPRLDPGGNGINAARIARRLGARAVVLGFAGGATGEQLERLLVDEGIHARFTRIRASTRTNVTVTNDSDHQQTRLTFPGPRITARETRALLAEIARLRAPGLFVLGGSLPPGPPPTFTEKLVRQASKSGLGVIADVPARFLAGLLATKSVRPRFILLKPNQTELEELLGRRLRSREAIVRAARELTSRSALVCVSLGHEGALLAAAGRVWLGRPIPVKARGTVGAGDSMVGAMAARLARLGLALPARIDAASDRVLEDVLAWGLAGGAATVATEGTALGQGSAIRALRPRARVVRIA